MLYEVHENFPGETELCGAGAEIKTKTTRKRKPKNGPKQTSLVYDKAVFSKATIKG